MRGYSIISDEERAQILNTHRSFYDGYATGNVPSNQTPLTVEDLAQDKNGLQVSNTGEVKQYNNHIHESAEVKEYSAPDMDVSDVEPAYDFVSGGPGLGETVEGRDEIKMDKESAWLEFLELNPSINSKTIHGARKHFEDMWSKTNISEEEGETCPSCGSPVEDCDCEGHDHKLDEKEMCEQCGSALVEGECVECGMYESIDEDLHEVFKTQRETILENFNRFKKFN